MIKNMLVVHMRKKNSLLANMILLYIHPKLHDDGEWDPSLSTQETLAVRVQPDRRVKTKEPGFRYMA
ncbi:unnamed protein product [Spirodela intermedia]|uniref:Uncharacterized protein n=1 Tax=Spirodela intermedia TaxID=51605 RepID=A0ABN7ECU1_SPIIN|nr:unnamed protein product [Spirodela intermedia]